MEEADPEELDRQLLADVKLIAEQFRGLYDEAYLAYAPAVDDICSRDASEREVDLFLDCLLDFAGEGRMLTFYKHVCRRYFYVYPEVVADHVYAWRSMYDEECTAAREEGSG